MGPLISLVAGLCLVASGLVGSFGCASRVRLAEPNEKLGDRCALDAYRKVALLERRTNDRRRVAAVVAGEGCAFSLFGGAAFLALVPASFLTAAWYESQDRKQITQQWRAACRQRPSPFELPPGDLQ